MIADKGGGTNSGQCPVLVQGREKATLSFGAGWEGWQAGKRLLLSLGAGWEGWQAENKS
jgi:hypothetical protein